MGTWLARAFQPDHFLILLGKWSGVFLLGAYEYIGRNWHLPREPHRLKGAFVWDVWERHIHKLEDSVHSESPFKKKAPPMRSEAFAEGLCLGQETLPGPSRVVGDPVSSSPSEAISDHSHPTW